MVDPSSHILIVDDDNDCRTLLSMTLRREGYRVKTANNGLEALDAVAKEDFSLVFMDIMMPVMDGREATAAIKKTEKGAALPIVACTATATFTNLRPEDLQKMGFADYIRKPIDLDLIYQAAERYAAVGAG